MLGRRNIILLCLTICIVHVKCADKYTDENRPYEFGFTIDGEQHRHEKKDENGIIMGEFGFITADGVYHVTVYATDENGNFKILSMKNIRVKPYPTAKSGPERGRSLEYSSSPQVLSKSLVPEQNKKQLKELPKPGPASPAKSCSHCKLPTTTTTTTTTQAPYIPSNELSQPVISQEPEIPPKYNKYEEKHSYEDVRAQGYLQHGQQQGQQQQQLQQVQQQGQQQQQLQQVQQQVQQGQQQQQLQQVQQQVQQGQQQQLQQVQQQLQQGQQHQVGQQPQEQQQQNQQPQGRQPVQQEKQGPQQQEQEQAARPQQQINLQQQGQAEQKPDRFNNEQNHSAHEIASGQNNAQNYEGNYPQQSTQEGLQSNDYQTQQQQQQQQQQQYSNNFAPEQSSALNQIGSPLNNPQSSQRANYNYPQPSYSQNGLGNTQIRASQGQINPDDKDESNNTESNIGQTQRQSVTSENQVQSVQPETNRNPKSYDDQLNQRFNTLSPPPNAFTPQENSPTNKPQLLSAQMQIVDKNTDIHYKRPGEKEGLPDGLTKDDMSQLLYTFNYTVGFHGHFEEGYKNGAKVGYYYVTGRNGVRTRVDYVADEKGFRPKITQEVLDLLSDDVPKPDTEKDPKYGLKGYEFKWLYYPVDTK